MIPYKNSSRRPRRFSLADSFLEQFKGEQPKWGYGGLSYFTFKRCVDVSTPVLCDDLRWRPAGELKEGDGIIGFDEESPGKYSRRHIRLGVVTHNKVEKAQTMGVELEDGTVLYATPDHSWLVKLNGDNNRIYWRETQDLGGTSKGGSVYLIRPLGPVWEEDTSYEAGYLAAAFDGEGCLDKARGLRFVQVDNEMLSKVEGFLDRKRVPYNRASKSEATESRQATTRLSIYGRRNVYSFLGRFRPDRLITRFRAQLEEQGGGALKTAPEDYVRVVRVFDAGERDIAVLSTSLKTHFTGGYASHNTYARPTCDCDNTHECDHPTEEWWQTCQRVVEGCYNTQKAHCRSLSLPWSEPKAQESAQDMFMRMWEFKFLPPGRGLWMMGTDFVRDTGGAALNNCAFTSTENIREDFASPFCFLMDMSMLGVGVGGDVRGQGTVTLHVPRLGEDKDVYVVDDSREGWVDLVRTVLTSFTGKGYLPSKIDYREIRHRGEPIKRFGGIASGPKPLRDLIVNLLNLLMPPGVTVQVFDTGDNDKGGVQTIEYVLDEGVESVEDVETTKITSAQIVDIFNFIGKAVVAGGVRRCLPKGTIVHTSEGLLPIEDVKVGMHVMASEGLSEVKDWVYQGVQPISVIRTQMGTFECTDKHKIAVVSGINGEYEWKQARELEPGDRMIFVDRPIEGAATDLPPYTYDAPEGSTTCKDITIPDLTEDVAWFLGLLHGDGCVHGDGRMVSLAFHEDQTDALERAKSVVGQFGVHASEISLSGEACVRLHVKSVQLTDYLGQFKQPNESMDVPECILKGSLSVRSAYVAGLADADGCFLNRPMIVAASVYPDYLEQVQSVLSSLGVPTRLRRHKDRTRVKKGWQPIYHLSLVGEKAIERFKSRVSPYVLKFEDNRKTSRSQNDYGFPAQMVKEAGQSYWKGGKQLWSPSSRQMTVATLDRLTGGDTLLIPVEVFEVEHEVREDETYDISVEAGEFVAQGGYLVHNTAEIMFGEHDDAEFMALKQDREALMDRRWASNNSILGKVGMDYTDVSKLIADNGEPGVIWLANMRAYSRMGDQPDGKDYRVMGSNPCITADTLIFTSEGPRRAIDLLNQPFGAVVDGRTYACETGVFQTGVKPVYRVKTKEGHSVKVTANHQILTAPKVTVKKRYETWVEAGDLAPGDKVVINNTRGVFWDGEGTFDEGWLIGNMLGDGHFHKAQESCKLQFWGEHKDHMLSLALDRVEKLGGDPRYHKMRQGTEVQDRDMVSTGSRRLWELALEHGLDVDKNFVNDKILQTSSVFQAGFLRGFFDAEGYVLGDQSKGVSVRIGLANEQHLIYIQKMLLNLGINSTIYRNRRGAGQRELPDGQGGTALYDVQEMHELVISCDNIGVFADQVGFDEPARQARLEEILSAYVRQPNRERFVATVESVDYIGVEPVYDCTVNEVHRFGAEGIVVHNCSEQSLESFELCCLVETFPAHHDDVEDYLSTLKKAYLYAKTVTLIPTHDSRTNAVMMRNRRIGCSMSGITQAMAKHGRRNFFNWCDTGYQYIRDLDKSYSDWLCIPRSIKTTSVKPSGTVSILAGSTPGIHYAHSEYYIRNVRVANTSPLVAACKKAGYPVHDDPYADDTSVVSFPIHEELSPETKWDVNIWQQFANAADMQRYWADNQVSITVSFLKRAVVKVARKSDGHESWVPLETLNHEEYEPVRNDEEEMIVRESEVDAIKPCLEVFETQLKSVSMLPLFDHGYELAPYEEISKAKYEELVANITELDLSGSEHEVTDLYCDGEACEVSF